MGNEHDTNGLLQKHIYRNKKNWKPKQIISGKWTNREQENNDKKQNNVNPNKQHKKWTQ